MGLAGRTGRDFRRITLLRGDEPLARLLCQSSNPTSMAYFRGRPRGCPPPDAGLCPGAGICRGSVLPCARPTARCQPGVLSSTIPPNRRRQMYADQFGVGPHTDFGVLTVLCQDDVGGLQVQNIDDEWLQAPPIPGTLIVNVADLLARWTAGAYKSTPHRVVNTSGCERMSLVLAYDPNPETMIDARDVFGGRVEGAEDPITCGDYLIWRFGRAFGYRKG